MSSESSLARANRPLNCTGSAAPNSSASDPRILIGLGQSAGATGVRVRWPNGRSEAYSIETGDTYVNLVEGDGEPVVAN